jgi:hypothetical protein
MARDVNISQFFLSFVSEVLQTSPVWAIALEKVTT